MRVWSWRGPLLVLPALLLQGLCKGPDRVQGQGLQSRFFYACADGNLSEVQALLEDGADTGTFDEDGRSPLHLAAASGHLEVTRLLLEKGVDVDIRTKDNGWTPLDMAACDGWLEVTGLLLEKGADIEARIVFPENDTADIGEIGNRFTPLFCAANLGHLETVRLLLEKGADTEACDSEWGMTPLLCAAERGYVEIVRLLLEKGADIEACDARGSGALIRAVAGGRLGVIRLLGERGADLEVQDKNGRSALLRAAQIGKLEVVLLLLELGADPRVRDRAGFCAGEQPKVQMVPAVAGRLPCGRSGWDFWSHVIHSLRFWQALGLALLLTYVSACCLGRPPAGFEPEAPAGARLLAAKAVCPPGALLVLQLYRALEVLTNTVQPMLLMLHISPPLWMALLLLLYALAPLSAAALCGHRRLLEVGKAEAARARARAGAGDAGGSGCCSCSRSRLAAEQLLQRPLLLLAACQHSLLRLGHWDRKLLGLLWAPGRLLLMFALGCYLVSQPRAWCSNRYGHEALEVIAHNDRSDFCLPLPQSISGPVQRTLLWRRQAPWEIAQGNCTLDPATFCIRSPSFNLNPNFSGFTGKDDNDTAANTAGDGGCRITVPQPATFRLDTQFFHTEPDSSNFSVGNMGYSGVVGNFSGDLGPPNVVPHGDLQWTAPTLAPAENQRWEICPGKPICLPTPPINTFFQVMQASTLWSVIVYVTASMVLLGVASLMHVCRCDCDTEDAVAGVTAKILTTLEGHPASEQAAAAISQIKGSSRGRCVKPVSVKLAAFSFLLDVLFDLNTFRILLVSQNYMFAAIIGAVCVGRQVVELLRDGFSTFLRAIAETKRTGVPTAAYLRVMGNEQGEACISLLVTSYSMAFSAKTPLDVISTSCSLLSSSWSLASYVVQEVDVATTELGSSTPESDDTGSEDSDLSSSESCSAASSLKLP